MTEKEHLKEALKAVKECLKEVKKHAVGVRSDYTIVEVTLMLENAVVELEMEVG